MARAPRADVKLLKSLRNLSSGYGPSAADTLGDGKHLLERASKLKSFVKDQKKKTKASSAKTEWLLDLKRLEDEWQEQACSYRQLLEDTATKDAGVLDVCKEASEQFQACDEELAGCGPALRGEVREMAEQVKAICCYGVEDPDLLEETRYVQQRLQHLTRKLSSQLQAMAGEAVHLSLVVRNAWPLFVDEDEPEEMEGEEAEAGGGSQLQVVGLLEPQLRLPSVSGIQDVELLVGRHPGTPQHLKEELMQTARALCCQYHSRLLHLQPGNCQDPSRPAGWSVDEHAVFRKSRALLFQQLPGKARQETRLQLLQRIADRLPGRCADEVAQYEDWYRRHQAIWQRRREVRLGWLRVMGQLLQEGERLLQDAAAAVLDQAALAADGVECEVQRVQLHGRLQVMREVKLEEDEKLAVDAARKAQEDAAKAALAAAAEQRRQARNKERVVVFREARRAELEAARAAELQQEAAAAASRQQQVVEQRSRVQLRQQELQQKQQLLQDKKAQLAQAEQARERRLESIRALVRVHAESDPGRLLQPTETSTALPQASQPAFRSVHGYTTQQLLSDQRFRLLEKLSSNGLHDSSQARAALAAARPFRPPRLDQFTSDQLAPY